MGKYNPDNLNKAYTEILQVLRYISPEGRAKIPKDLMELFRAKQDRRHRFRFDPRKDMDDQLLYETQLLYACLYADYWADPEERERIRKRDEEYLRKKRFLRLKEMVEEEQKRR